MRTNSQLIILTVFSSPIYPTIRGQYCVSLLADQYKHFFMIKRLIFFFQLIVLSSPGQSVGFAFTDTVPVLAQGNELEFGWAGGLNFTQWSQIDLNFDNQLDLIVFDKSGHRFLPFESFEENGTLKYRYAPQHIPAFPEIMNWVLFRDYNLDGKMDIWAHTNAGIAVYTNESTLAGGLQFTYALNTPQLFTNYGTPVDVNLYVASTDIPAVEDIDGDGDLDVLTFSILGTNVEYHKCLSVELYGHSDSLIYELGDDCWGLFKESFVSNTVYLDTCSANIAPGGANRPRHAGSAIAVRDLTGNGSMDCLLGDITFNNANFLTNSGTPQDAHMTAQDPAFPSYDVPINLELFPGFHWVDIDLDGDRDMVVSPNASAGARNTQSVWFYDNKGTDALPDFEFQQTDFFQDRMIDVGEGAFPKLADLNGDNLLDLVIGNHGILENGTISDSRLALFLNTGTASKPEYSLDSYDFAGISSLPFTVSLIPAFGDLDGDGDLDMILGDGNGNIHYFANTAGASNLANYVLAQANVGGIDVGSTAAPDLADLDRDGDLDLIIGHSTGRIKYYENLGSSTSYNFSLVTDTLGGINMSNPFYFLGYATPTAVDQNGAWEIWVGGAPGYVHRFTNIENNLSGSFTLADTLLTGLQRVGRPAVAAGDINSDGYTDMILGNYSGGVHLYMGIDSLEISVEEIPVENQWLLYPNPTKGSFSIAHLTSNSLVDVRVLDLNGRLVYSGFTLDAQITLPALPGGYYIVQLTQENKSEVHRLVVQP